MDIMRKRIITQQKKSVHAYFVLYKNPFAHIMRVMNTLKHIRTKIFNVSSQADFAAEIEVAQSTVSRWENGAAPSLDEMQKVRAAAARRGLPWNDSWFFELVPSEAAA